MQLASIVRWFESGVNPPYGLNASTFQGRFDPSLVLHPGMRDRAFRSGTAIAQIHVCAVLRSDKSKHLIPGFPCGFSPEGVPPFVRRVETLAVERFPNTTKPGFVFLATPVETTPARDDDDSDSATEYEHTVREGFIQSDLHGSTVPVSQGTRSAVRLPSSYPG